jgi:hypothetical protein
MDTLLKFKEQLTLLHIELRNIKKFFKESATNFKQFHCKMNDSLKILDRPDLFNEIHFLEYTNFNIIEFFNSQVIYALTFTFRFMMRALTM